MKPQTSIPLGPWSKGLQNVNDPAMTPKGCVVEAENVLIESDGTIHPRAGFAPLATGCYSLFKHNDVTYGVFDQKICKIDKNGASPISNVTVDAPVTWGVLNGDPVFTNVRILGRVTDEHVKLIGVETPVVSNPLNAPLTYKARAVAFVNEDGEEGPLSPIFEEGSVEPPMETTVRTMRVYAPLVHNISEPDEGLYAAGDVLYFLEEVLPSAGVDHKDPNASGAADANSPIGRPAETMNKARMPGGNYVRYWRGRLLVARGRTLFISDPLRYGLYDLASGFVPFEATIDFIEPLESGVFVALRNLGVFFLAGDAPERWERKVADVIPAQPKASLTIPTAQMTLDLKPKPEWVAVWFTHKGFAIGLPSGDVLYPQADLLSGLPLGNGSLHFEGDRLTVLTQ